jgi:hypothetical protein
MNRPGLFVFLKSRGLHLGFPASGWKLIRWPEVILVLNPFRWFS